MKLRGQATGLRLFACWCLAGALAGCTTRASRPRHVVAPANDAALACNAAESPIPAGDSSLPVEVASATDVVAEVRVEGNHSVPDAVILHGLATTSGALLDPEKLDSDLIRLHELGVFEDVRVALGETRGGSAVVFRVRERPLIRNVFHATGSDRVAQDEWPSPLEGDVYDAAAAHRSADELRRMWQADGYLDARVVAHARRVGEDRVDLCFALERGPKWEIEKVSFPGARIVAEADLLEVLRKRSSTANQPGTPWRPELMGISRLELSSLLYERGLVASRVMQPRLTRDAVRHRLTVEIPIEEGKVFHLGKVDLSGKLRAPRSEYLRALGLAPGAVFVRSELVRGFDRLQELHRSHGGKPELVDRSVETHDEEATIDLVVKVGG